MTIKQGLIKDVKRFSPCESNILKFYLIYSYNLA